MTYKIVHIIIGLRVGGAELMLKRLIEGLNGEDGMQHSVISLTDLGLVGQQLQSAGINIKTLGMNTPLLVPSTFFKLRRELKKQKPDIVQTWMYHANFLGGLAAKSIGIDRVIWNIRNTSLHANGNLNLIFRKSSALLSSSVPYEVIYVSHSAQKAHLKAGYTPNKGVVIENGFNTDIFLFNKESRDKYRSEMKLEFDDIAIFSVGRCVSEKDHPTFIKAICRASKSNSKIIGVLIGRDIDLESFGLSDNEKKNFIVLGERKDIAGLLSAADVFCLHSITEGFPNVLGEAMSVGLPCITTKAGDAELILSNKKYTVETGGFLSIAKLIIELSGYSVINRGVIGMNNREKILKDFSLETILNKYSDLYKN